MAENVSITNLPAATEVKSGDFIILETSDGTQIIDYKDFVIGKDNVTFWPRLSGNTTNIKTLSTTQTALSSELASFRTTVSDVSGLSGIVWKDTWNSALTYKISQAVAYNNSSFIALAENTNEKPVGSDGSLNANWNYLAKAGVSDLTNKGGLLVGDGTGTSIQLNPGASGYVLKSQGTGNQLTWAVQDDTGRPGSVCDKLSIWPHEYGATPAMYGTEACQYYLMSNGTVKSAGEGLGIGQGHITAVADSSPVPQPVTLPAIYDYQSADDKIKDIYQASMNTLLLTVSGEVYITGDNAYKQLGDNTTTDNHTFTKLSFPDAGVVVKEIYTGETNNASSGQCFYFLTENYGYAPNDGRLYVVGGNHVGNYGNGDTAQSGFVVQAAGGMTNIEKIWVGNGHQHVTVFARKTDGAFYAWGAGVGNYSAGGLTMGNNSATDLYTPTLQINPTGSSNLGFTPGDQTTLGLHGVQDIKMNKAQDHANQYSTTIALLTSGHVYACGFGGTTHATLPKSAWVTDNDTATYNTWTLIGGVSAAQSIHTSGGHYKSSCIVACSAIIGGSWNTTTHKYEGFTDMTATSGVILKVWGNNDLGCWANGDTTDIFYPQKMDWLPAQLAPAVSAVQIHKDLNMAVSSGNQRITLIRDLSGYYWAAGSTDGGAFAFGLSTDANIDGEATTFTKIPLPVDPSEIKKFDHCRCDAFSGDVSEHYFMILTHNGRVFLSGQRAKRLGVGYAGELADGQGSCDQWRQVTF